MIGASCTRALAAVRAARLVLPRAAAAAAGVQVGTSAAVAARSLPLVPRRTLFGQKFEVGEIHAIRREATGSREAQAARRKQLIPGIVYGYDEAGNDTTELIYIREADLRREVNKRKECFYNTLFDIVLDGKRTRVLPRDFQIHPFRPRAIAINWLRYRVGAYPGVKLEIPLKSFNEERCPCLREGGWMLELIHKMPVYASGEAIPDYLMMDTRGLKSGDKIMASDIQMNDGIMLRSKVRDFAVARLFGSRRTDDADGDATAAAGGKDDKKAAAGKDKAAAK